VKYLDIQYQGDEFKDISSLKFRYSLT